MKLHHLLLSFLAASTSFAAASIIPPQHPLAAAQATTATDESGETVSQALFDELEELARVVDIAYCVGTLNSGIDDPFQCLSFCKDFPDFELIQTWNTGMTLSDSCGYLALDHNRAHPRIVVAFRGTYSLTNAIVDLTAGQQEYLPYPSDGHTIEADKCEGCFVHQGFLESWSQTEKIVGNVVKELRNIHPDYQLTLVGHSLGGAVAALAALDFGGRGWKPRVVTFGEPKVGNEDLAEFINKKFDATTYSRVTHVDDPVPQLPLAVMGYRHHAHEVYLTRRSMPCTKDDVRVCHGNEDPDCAAGHYLSVWRSLHGHRDYFHRMGLCLPPGSFFHRFGEASEPEMVELR